MMDICYAIADEKGTYSKFLGTSLWSLCERHGAKDLHIHLLHDGSLREKEKLRFRQAAMHFGQQLSFYNVEVLAAAELDYLRQELPQAGVSRYTYAAFYRLLAARLLPREVKRFIYFDADTVIHMDIANLWQINLEGYPLAAVAEYDEVGYPADNLMVAAGWMDGKAYFNSGVLLVDREKFLAQGDILWAGIKRLKQLKGFVFYDDKTKSYDKGYLDWLDNIKFDTEEGKALYDKLAKIYKDTIGKDLTPEEARRLGKDKKFGQFHTIYNNAYSNHIAPKYPELSIDDINIDDYYTPVNNYDLSGLLGETPIYVKTKDDKDDIDIDSMMIGF